MAGAEAGVRSNPLRHYLSTSDPELAAEALRDSYRFRGGVRISDVTDGFHFTQEILRGHGFAVTRFQTSATVGYDGPLDGLLCVGRVHAGRLSVETARGPLRAGAGGICLVPPHEQWRATTEDVDLAPVVLDRDSVASHAAAICGIEPDSLVFSGLEPVSPGAAVHWNATVAHVRDDILGDPDVAAAPLIQAETLRMLVVGVLAMFPNSAVDALGDRPAGRTRGAEPATIRRAVEFIEANAQLPIGITDIAESARIGVRGLQYNFRRYRGCTPLEYLRRARLAGAHRDLVAGDPTNGDAVVLIATRWGFTNPGRFSVEYRRCYGRSPSETLRL